MRGKNYYQRSNLKGIYFWFIPFCSIRNLCNVDFCHEILNLIYCGEITLKFLFFFGGTVKNYPLPCVALVENLENELF